MGGEGQEAGTWTVPEKKKKTQECQLLPPLTHVGLTQLLPACGVLGEVQRVLGVPQGWGEENLLQKYRGRGIER